VLWLRLISSVATESFNNNAFFFYESTINHLFTGKLKPSGDGRQTVLYEVCPDFMTNQMSTLRSEILRKPSSLKHGGSIHSMSCVGLRYLLKKSDVAVKPQRAQTVRHLQKLVISLAIQ
jgi:hypothetical protein